MSEDLWRNFPGASSCVNKKLFYSNVNWGFEFFFPKVTWWKYSRLWGFQSPVSCVFFIYSETVLEMLCKISRLISVLLKSWNKKILHQLKRCEINFMPSHTRRSKFLNCLRYINDVLLATWLIEIQIIFIFTMKFIIKLRIFQLIFFSRFSIQFQDSIIFN